MKKKSKHSQPELQEIEQQIDRDNQLLEESRKKTARRRRKKEEVQEKASSWERVFAPLILISTIVISFLIMKLSQLK